MWTLCVGSLCAQEFSKPRLLPVNSSAAEFGAIWYEGGILFSSERNNSTAGVTHTQKSTGTFLSDFYTARRKDSTRWARPTRFLPRFNSRLHDGPVAHSPDSTAIVLVRSHRIPNNPRKAEGKPITSLFLSTRTGGSWDNPEPIFPIDPTATVTDPAFSHDGAWLYFAAELPGGLGGLDLYRVPWPLDGTPPENLGPDINTAAQERYPFLDAKGRLYFSSTGHKGLGGVDLFVAKPNRSSWRTPLNLGAPLNTEFDDFGLHLNPDGTEGLLISNRKAGGLDDDIYTFAVTEIIEFDCKPQEKNSYCYEIFEEGTGELPIPTLFYQWDFGDGHTARGVRNDHCFPGPGDYHLSLAVYDSLTNAPVFEQTQYVLEIRDAVQAVISGPDTLAPGMTAEWNAAASNLPDFEAEKWEWDFGDGATAEGEQVSHVYEADGAYTLQLVGMGADAAGEALYHCVTREVTVRSGAEMEDGFAPVAAGTLPSDSKTVVFEDSGVNGGNDLNGGKDAVKGRNVMSETGELDGANATNSNDEMNGTAGNMEGNGVRNAGRSMARRISDFRNLPNAQFRIQAGTTPVSFAHLKEFDQRLKAFEQVQDGDVIRYVMPEVLGFDEAMRKLREVRGQGFAHPAVLVFRGDSLVPQQPFLDNWLPADSVPVTVVRGVVTDRKDLPRKGTVVWENLVSGEVVVETPIDQKDGSFEQVLPKDVFYGYYVDLEGYYSISRNLDLRDYSGDLVLRDSLQVLSIEDLIRDHIPVRINNLFFDFDKFSIRKTSHRELYRLARFLLEHPDLAIEIAGHTDDRGDDNYNLQLSRKRAASVARFLVLSGCQPKNITPAGYGETRPVAPNSEAAGRQHNRRVEFTILSDKNNTANAK
ncbi:MAG: PKD domain-containing protein [Bacteroidota bacterium]